MHQLDHLARTIAESVAHEPDLCARDVRPGASSETGVASDTKRSTNALTFQATDLRAVSEFVEACRELVFPGFFSTGPMASEPRAGLDPEALADRLRPTVERVWSLLVQEVAAVLSCPSTSRTRAQASSAARGAGDPVSASQPRKILGQVIDGLDAERINTLAGAVATEFLAALPAIRAMLAKDVHAAFDGDPAAENIHEIILCYPGIDAVFAHRIAHRLYTMGIPVLPRVISEQAHSRTGIDIHPGARIGESIFIDHGTATVIGETAVIGTHVRIYQGVTLGARSFVQDGSGRLVGGTKRHPTIGDRVIIYAGAVILGGDTLIGDDCVIGGGVFVTSSVPAGHVVQQKRAELLLRSAPVQDRAITPANSGTGNATEKAAEMVRDTGQAAGEQAATSWWDIGSGI